MKTTIAHTHYSIIKGKVVIFLFLEHFVLPFQKAKLNQRHKNLYAFIWSGDWLPWLEITRLGHQFSEQ